VQIEFLSSIAIITTDQEANRRLFVDGIGLPLVPAAADDAYLHSEQVPGSKHFGLWPLEQAARSCFGTHDWPADRPVPQVSVEFDVADAAAVQAAVEELRAQGHDVLHDAREEPWGQTVAHLQTPEGVLVGISFAPWHHG
jgi:catechol 2,3-dioxygenase-like lactoylglutathione lyase family enzyme